LHYDWKILKMPVAIINRIAIDMWLDKFEYSRKIKQNRNKNVNRNGMKGNGASGNEMPHMRWRLSLELTAAYSSLSHDPSTWPVPSQQQQILSFYLSGPLECTICILLLLLPP
jgi:hypothetical protein